MQETDQLHVASNTRLRLGGPNSQPGRLGVDKSLSVAGNRRFSPLASWPVTSPDSHMKLQYSICIIYICGAHGGAVVEVLRYKPEGSGIDSRLCH
jgi:hypothetical protein